MKYVINNTTGKVRCAGEWAVDPEVPEGYILTEERPNPFKMEKWLTTEQLHGFIKSLIAGLPLQTRLQVLNHKNASGVSVDEMLDTLEVYAGVTEADFDFIMSLLLEVATIFTPDNITNIELGLAKILEDYDIVG